MHADESPEEALEREWDEELDAAGQRASSPDRFARDDDVTLLFFRVRALLGEPRPKGCARSGGATPRGADSSRCRPPTPGRRPPPRRRAAVSATRRARGRPLFSTTVRERVPFIDGSADLAPGQVDPFPEGGAPGASAVLDGLLVGTPSGPRAFENLCPHVPIALDQVHDDILSPDGRRLVCQNHAALFDLPSGLCLAGPCEGEALREIPIDLLRRRLGRGRPMSDGLILFSFSRLRRRLGLLLGCRDRPHGALGRERSPDEGGGAPAADPARAAARQTSRRPSARSSSATTSRTRPPAPSAQPSRSRTSASNGASSSRRSRRRSSSSSSPR